VTRKGYSSTGSNETVEIPEDPKKRKKFWDKIKDKFKKEESDKEKKIQEIKMKVTAEREAQAKAKQEEHLAKLAKESPAKAAIAEHKLSKRKFPWSPRRSKKTGARKLFQGPLVGRIAGRVFKKGIKEKLDERKAKKLLKQQEKEAKKKEKAEQVAIKKAEEDYSLTEALKKDKEVTEPPKITGKKHCPFCLEKIDANATTCPKCNSPLTSGRMSEEQIKELEEKLTQQFKEQFSTGSPGQSMGGTGQVKKAKCPYCGRIQETSGPRVKCAYCGRVFNT